MNRRQLLRLAPAMVAAPLVREIRVDQGIDPIARNIPAPGMQPVRIVDTRPVFRLSDWVLVRPRPSLFTGDALMNKRCQGCGNQHAVYTHGCHPVAFPKGMDNESLGLVFPATLDAVPLGLYTDACTLDRYTPHRHEDFRWE